VADSDAEALHPKVVDRLLVDRFLILRRAQTQRDREDQPGFVPSLVEQYGLLLDQVRMIPLSSTATDHALSDHTKHLVLKVGGIDRSRSCLTSVSFAPATRRVQTTDSSPGPGCELDPQTVRVLAPVIGTNCSCAIRLGRGSLIHGR
jgi:hypothetical protein